jgi:hypothetical protein
MGMTKQIADEFLGWWIDPASNPGFSRRFAHGFTYRKEPVGLADSEAVWFIEQKLPWSKVDVRSKKAEGDTALILIEGVDPVTDLRHEIRWELVVRGERIVSVVERVDTIG